MHSAEGGVAPASGAVGPISTGPPRLTALRELQLLEAHRAGDPKALTELLTSYQRRMYAICHRMLGDDESASDATQDAILKVISGFDSYDGRAKLSTWVIRITLNCCYDRLRSDRRHRHAPLAAAHAEAEKTALNASSARHREPSATTTVQQRESREALLRALSSLDPQFRAILVLRDVQELDYQQVADVMDVPVGTVKSRLFRARAALRDAFERAQPAEDRDTGGEE